MYLQAEKQGSISYIKTNETQNHFTLAVKCTIFLCNHRNGDLFTYEDNMQHAIFMCQDIMFLRKSSPVTCISLVFIQNKKF